jgi:nucleoside-diphosphate-sugar epimerase
MESVRYKVQFPGIGEPIVMRMQARSRNVALVGSDTFIGSALAKAMEASERHVMPCQSASAADVSIPDGCNTVLFCHDVYMETERHAALLDALCRRLAEKHADGNPVHVCVFTPAAVCQPTGGVVRENSPTRPYGRWGVAACHAELLLHAWQEMTSNAIIPHIFRYGELYGEPCGKETGLGHLNAALRLARQGKPVQMRGFGLQKRSLTHVDDFSRAVAAVLAEYGLPRIVNIPGERMPIAQYMNAIAAAFNVGLEYQASKADFDENQPSFSSDCVLSAAVFRSLVAYKPKIRFMKWLETIHN